MRRRNSIFYSALAASAMILLAGARPSQAQHFSFPSQQPFDQGPTGATLFLGLGYEQPEPGYYPLRDRRSYLGGPWRSDVSPNDKPAISASGSLSPYPNDSADVSASGYVNMASGKMGGAAVAYGSDGNFYAGMQATFWDTVSFTNHDELGSLEDLEVTVDGSRYAPPNHPEWAGAVLYYFDGQTAEGYRIYQSGSQTFHFTIPAPVGTSQRKIGLRLSVGAQEVGEADFSHTLTANLHLSPGVTYTSVSGMFLTQTTPASVPEPGGFVFTSCLTLSGLSLWRHRKTK